MSQLWAGLEEADFKIQYVLENQVHHNQFGMRPVAKRIAVTIYNLSGFPKIPAGLVFPGARTSLDFCVARLVGARLTTRENSGRIHAFRALDEMGKDWDATFFLTESKVTV